MRRNVEIHMPGAKGNPTDILLDGEPVKGVTGYTIEHQSMHDVPRLTLDLGVLQIDHFGDAEVYISDRARETLERFGWTPPSEKAIS